ncbi:MAG: DUF937 domain-containing protein [Acidobacteriota bacterium]|nr:DUF937 domain-containing protein [Acidobacteriota bacterium]
MSLMDDLFQQAGNLTSGMSQEHAGLANGVLDMLKNNQGGGLSGLVQQFQSNGLGNIVSSWVGNGQNQPISAEQVQSALGSEKIQELAGKAGISPDQAGAGLAQVLPKLIDTLTPGGQIPQVEGVLGAAASFLKGKLGS